VVTGRALDVQSQRPILPPSPVSVNNLDLGGRYQSFSILLHPIPTRFELEEMCNIWERDVTVYFDLHIGGRLLEPYLAGDTRGQIRSLNRQVSSPGSKLIVGNSCRIQEWSSNEESRMVFPFLRWLMSGCMFALRPHF
jgi:hypothetical protein